AVSQRCYNTATRLAWSYRPLAAKPEPVASKKASANKNNTKTTGKKSKGASRGSFGTVGDFDESS
ncbi:unnamed protein product, partial [Amoebophrya sp. A25]